MPETVAAYARLSHLRGRDENIDEQQRLNTLAAQGRWPDCAVHYYEDPDASGEREDVTRPDFDRLRADIASGAITQVVASDQERLTRRPDVLEQLIDLLRSAGVEGFLGYRDGWTSVIEGQSAGARYKGVGAKEYVEGIKVKVNEKLDLLASQGRPGPGNCFGYRHVKRDGRTWLEIVEEEAAAIRWAADALLSGWTLAAVTEEWNRRELPCRRQATTWMASTVAQVMHRSAAIAGKRTHRGVIVGDGDWTPILDEVTWRRLQALFEARKRTRPARRYLLTGGLALCGLSDEPLVAVTQSRKGRSRWPVYECHKYRHADGTTSGCGKITVSAAALEDHVTQVLKRYLRSEEFAARVAAVDAHAERRRELADELAALEADRKAYTGQRGRREIDDEEWEILRSANAVARAGLNAALVALPAPVAVVDPEALLADFDEMVLGEKRGVLGMALSRVVVDPASRRGPVFDGSRVHVFDHDGVELTA